MSLTVHIRIEFTPFIVLQVDEYIDHISLVVALWDSATECVIFDAFRFEKLSDICAFDCYESETAVYSSIPPFRSSVLGRNAPKCQAFILYKKLRN